MFSKAIVAIIFATTILWAGTAVYLEINGTSSNLSFSDLKSGTHLTITNQDKKMLGGAMIVNFNTNGYYGLEFNLSIGENSIITGSWSSTGKSLVWFFMDSEVYMETPLPDLTSGVLNQTMVPGHYTLVIGGYPGDIVSITDTIQIRNYSPQQVGNFCIPAGTHISPAETYSFYLNQPGELVGELTTPDGAYSVSLHSNSGVGFTSGCSNISAKSATISYSLGPNYEVFAPGYYNLTLSNGFYVGQGIEFLHFYDYSII